VNGVGGEAWDVGRWGKVASLQHCSHIAKWPEPDGRATLSYPDPHIQTYYYYY